MATFAIYLGFVLPGQCLGLSLAAGSGFTNGLSRLLPGPYHVPPSFFVPTFVPLALLIFWMIRVRTSGHLHAALR